MQIEVSDDLIKKCLQEYAEKLVREHVRSLLGSYSFEQELRATLKEAAEKVVASEIDRQVKDADSVRSVVAEQLQAIIKRQLNAAIKAAEKEA